MTVSANTWLTEWQGDTVYHPVNLIYTFHQFTPKLFQNHILQNKISCSFNRTWESPPAPRRQHNDLPLAVSPLLLFRFRIMMTRPSPSLLLHGAPLVPIEMERWNVRPLLPSLSLSLRGPSDIGWTENNSDKTQYTNYLQYINFIILQKQKL